MYWRWTREEEGDMEEEVVMEGREGGGETLFNTYDTTTLSQVNAPKLFFVPPNC